MRGIICTAVGIALLGAVPQASQAGSGIFYIPWGHVSGGKGVEYDAFISLRNLDENEPATVNVIYINSEGSRLKETGEFIIGPLATELVNVEDTILNWGIGSARIEWSSAGDGQLIGAAYILDRQRGLVTDMPVVSKEDAEAADARYVPYGRITDGVVRGYDTYIFLKNTSQTESSTVSIVYYSHTGEATRTADPIVLPPTGSAIANVENTIDPDFGWGGAEITWSPLSDGTVVTAAALINWDTMLVSSIPVK